MTKSVVQVEQLFYNRRIYDKLRKEPELKSSYAIKGGFKEFAAEMFALGRKVIGNSNFKWRKEYKDAYDLIIQFPRKNKK